MTAGIDQIMEFANYYGIPVIEDTAEAFGSKYKGKVLGLIGKCSLFSFYRKKLSQLQVGALFIKDEKLIVLFRFLFA